MASNDLQQCRFYEAGQCSSCTLMPVPQSEQIAQAQADVGRIIAARNGAGEADAGGIEWLPPIVSEPWGFRTKAKMAVVGTAAAPILTFPGGDSDTDLAACPLYPPLVTEVLETAREVIRRAQIPPYSVEARKGEVKYVLVTASESEALVRFVLRSENALPRLREHADKLDPRAVSVSANIQPAPTPIIEGDVDVPIAGADRLRMRVGPITLGVLPQSFTQTNLGVTASLYAQAAQWLLDRGVTSAWDLYCGVGGFALTLAHEARQRGADVRVEGVEIAPAAIESARASAEELGLENVRLTAGNATAWASAQPVADRPNAVIVNPPRRGIGPVLSEWLNTSGVETIVYSSCHPETLGADLRWMSAYEVVAARLVDMFPHTAHNEVIVLLRRKDSDA